MIKWYNVKINYPSRYIIDMITYQREINKWLEKNNIEQVHSIYDIFSFKNEKDAMHFELVWG